MLSAVIRRPLVAAPRCGFWETGSAPFVSVHGRYGRTLRTEELSGDVECLAAHHDDLLAAQQLLGNNAGKTAQKVTLAVNDDLSDTQKSQQIVLVVLMMFVMLILFRRHPSSASCHRSIVSLLTQGLL